MSEKLFIDFDYMKVLRALAEGPAKREELVERVGEEFSSSATTRLKDHGYIEGRKIPTDPHRLVWALSEKGERVIRERAETWQETEAILGDGDV